MALKEYLKENELYDRNHISALADKPLMKAMANDLAQRYPEGGALLTVLNIKETLEFIVQDEKQNWRNVTDKQWKTAAWTIWGTEKTLLDYPKSCDAYKKWLSKTEKKSAYRTLIVSYLHSYTPDLKGTEWFLKKIASKIKTWKNTNWNDRHIKYDIFTVSMSHKKIATACLTPPYDFHSVYFDVGLTGVLEKSGLASSLYLDVIKRVRKALLSNKSDTENIIKKFVDWSFDGQKMKFPQYRTEFINALLEPWERKRASENLREYLMEIMARYFKDLRIDAREWNGTSHVAQSVMKRWLAKESLERFLRIVDETADVGQWEYRRALWLGYFDAEYLTEAWVAFADDGFELAKRSFEEHNFGYLNGSNIDQNHAVLIMKIGDLTIADWSHSGKCRIWNAENKRAPKLYKKRYCRPELVESSDMLDVTQYGVTHSYGDRGTWQNKVVNYIQKQTGLRLKYQQFMP